MTAATKPQAKNIADVDLLRAVDRLATDGRWPNTARRWVLIWELADEFPQMPFKVVRAKCSALIRRGLLSGCTCGCRGDFEIQEPGFALLRG